MGVGSFICLIGAIVQAAAKNVNYLISGRVVLGLGAIIVQTAGKIPLHFSLRFVIIMLLALGPAYVVELSHPAYRAVLTGL
jgi:hypothetical protein